MTTHIRTFMHLLCAFAAVVSIGLPAKAQTSRFKLQGESTNSRDAISLLIRADEVTPQQSSSQGGGRRKGRSSDEEEEIEQPPSPTPPPAVVERTRKVELGFRYWVVASKASVTIRDGVGNTAATGRAALNLDSGDAPEGRFVWQFTRRNKLRVDYMQLSTNAAAADVSLLLSGAGFTPDDIGSVGMTKLETRQLRIGYAWQGLRIGDKLRAGPLVEWRGLLFDTSTTALPTPMGGTPVDTTGRFGLAMLNIGADVNIVPHRYVEVSSIISGIPVAGLGRALDIDNEVKFYMQRFMNLSVGYRYMRLRADSGSNFAELTMRGPIFGVGFRF